MIADRKPETVGIYRLTMKTDSDSFRQYAIQGVIERLKAADIKVVVYEPVLEEDESDVLRVVKDFAEFKQVSDVIVVISSDEFNDLKGKKSYYSFEQRKIILEAVRYVDEVIPEHNWEQKQTDVIDHNIDLFVMGDDWKGEFDSLSEHCEVVYLPRTDGISTTKIKKDLNKA